jgi:hypothetical protein
MGNWRGNNWVHILCDIEGSHPAHDINVELDRVPGLGDPDHYYPDEYDPNDLIDDE